MGWVGRQVAGAQPRGGIPSTQQGTDSFCAHFMDRQTKAITQ